MTHLCGRQIVEAVGKPVRLASAPRVVRRLDIYALSANTARVYVGCRNVRAKAGQECGWPLVAPADVTSDYLNLQELTFVDVDMYDLWIDARVADEGVTWGAVE